MRAVTAVVPNTSTAYLNLVAVYVRGAPFVVPRLVPETADEERRQFEAETRRRNRLAEREEILEGRRTAEGARG